MDDAFGRSFVETPAGLAHNAAKYVRGVDAWARLLARGFDTLIYAMLLRHGAWPLVVVSFRALRMDAPVDAAFGRDLGPMVIWWMVWVLLWLLIEPICLNRFGATLGKALMGIAVSRGDGTRVSIGRAMSRWLFCWARGQGLGLPGLSLVTHLLAYNRLRDRGDTAWDARLDCVVTRTPVSGIRWFVAGASFAAIMVINVAAQFEALQQQ